MPPAASPDSSTSVAAEPLADPARRSLRWFVAVPILALLILGLRLQNQRTSAQQQQAESSVDEQLANGFRSETVRRGRLVRTVPVRGEIATHQPGIVYNDCRYWPRKIVELVPEGTQVQPGDILCELDAAEIRTKLRPDPAADSRQSRLADCPRQ